jgi:hypothetical protein
VQLDINPARAFIIKINLRSMVKEIPIKCLKVNTDMFACSSEEMPGIDLSMACHHLNVNPNMKYVTERRCHQFLEKAEVAKTIFIGILQVNFILKIIYPE